MISRDQIEMTIYEVIDNVNLELPSKMKLEKSRSTVLYGANSSLDSLGLVNLIVATEQQIFDKFSISISIADDRALSQKNSPFLSIQTLIDHIGFLIEEQGNE